MDIPAIHVQDLVVLLASHVITSSNIASTPFPLLWTPDKAV